MPALIPHWPNGTEVITLADSTPGIARKPVAMRAFRSFTCLGSKPVTAMVPSEASSTPAVDAHGRESTDDQGYRVHQDRAGQRDFHRDQEGRKLVLIECGENGSDLQVANHRPTSVSNQPPMPPSRPIIPASARYCRGPVQSLRPDRVTCNASRL